MRDKTNCQFMPRVDENVDIRLWLPISETLNPHAFIPSSALSPIQHPLTTR